MVIFVGLTDGGANETAWRAFHSHASEDLPSLQQQSSIKGRAPVSLFTPSIHLFQYRSFSNMATSILSLEPFHHDAKNPANETLWSFVHS
jgi:hypothetical protein